ncbi:MAG: thioesterase family protein [Pseudomonadota bacterium]
MSHPDAPQRPPVPDAPVPASGVETNPKGPVPGRRPRASRSNYHLFREMPTRWHDNDVYGHMNNVVYYSFFDTAVNLWLCETAGLVVPGGAVIGLVVETGCTYHESVGWPAPVSIGLATSRVGRSSVSYALGLFGPEADLAAAEGRFTHVYVDAGTRRPVALPDSLRNAARAILREV